MNRVNQAIRNLTYRSFSPVSKVLACIKELAETAFEHRDPGFIRRLLSRLYDWHSSINNYRSYYEYREQIAAQFGHSFVDYVVLFNLRKASREVSNLIMELDDLLLKSHGLK